MARQRPRRRPSGNGRSLAAERPDALRAAAWQSLGMAATTGGESIAPGFARFWWAEAVSGFGTAITLLALQTLVVVTLQSDAVAVGWLNTFRWLPYLVLGLVVGAMVDRVRRRPVMIVTDLTRAVLLAAIPLAWVLGVLTFPTLMVIVVLFGTVSLVNDGASQSFIPRLVPRSALQRAHARLDGADAVAQTAGPAVGGALIRLVGAPLAVLVDAASYLFSALMLTTLRVSEPAPVAERWSFRRFGGEVAAGVRWVYGESGLRRMAVATQVWFAGQATLLVVVVPFAYLQLGLSALQLGLVFALTGVGAVVGAATSTRVGRRLGTGGAIWCANLTSAAGVVVMAGAALAPTGWLAAAVLALGQLGHGWSMGLSNSHEMTFRQALTPDELQARTNTTLRSLNRAVIVVVSPLAGLCADRFGFVAALAAAAAIFASAALMLILSPLRRVRIE